MKTQLSQLLNSNLGQGYIVASETLSIGEKAERIVKQAKDAQDENGEFAKMFASNIEQWMQEIADMAQKSIDRQLKKVEA